MPISYAERKKRRQAILQGLAPELQERLALRHVEAVVKLPLEAQHTLALALSAGLPGIPAAIACLREHPQASLEEVLHAGMDGRGGEPDSPPPKPALLHATANPDPDALSELAGLLQDCFPGMPEMTREALAADELLSGVLALVRARRACFRSTAIQSELVFVALCGLAVWFIDELNQLMASRPYYYGALLQSGLALRWAQGKLPRQAQSKLLRQAPQGEGNQGRIWPFDEQSGIHIHPPLRAGSDQGFY
jgi:hypothetical protein